MELSELIESLEEEINEQLLTIFNGDPIQPTSVEVDATLVKEKLALNIYIFINSGEHRIVNGERLFFPPSEWDGNRIKARLNPVLNKLLSDINRTYQTDVNIEPYPEQGN